MIRRAPVSSGSLHKEILDTACQLLIEHGYDRLSMRRIGEAAGVSATAIYLYYENKDALFRAIVDEGMDRLHAELTAAAWSHGTPRVRFRRICEAYLTFGLNNREFYEVMFVVRSDRMARFPAADFRLARRNLDLLIDLLQESVPLRRSDATTRATAVWAALHGVVSLLIAQRVDVRVEERKLLEETLANVECACFSNEERLSESPRPGQGRDRGDILFQRSPTGN